MRLISRISAVLIGLTLTAASAIAQQQTINIGAAAQDGSGDTLRGGGAKINNNFTQLFNTVQPALTGDITKAANSNVTAITSGVIVNSDFSTMPAFTAKCNYTSSAHAPFDCTAAQMTSWIGSSGGGGTSGLSNQVDLCTYTNGSNSVDPTGVADSTAAVAAAFAQVQDNLSTGVPTNTALYVNCPVLLSIGYDHTKPIFVHSGTNIVFGPQGKFMIDNNTIGAFYFQNVAGSTWRNARIQYVGAVTINNNAPPTYVGGTNGGAAGYTGGATTAGTFNDTEMKADLVAQGYTFTSSGSSLWNGPTNAACSFIIRGSSHNVNFINARFFVADGTNAANFNPCVFSLDAQWKPGAISTNSNPVTSTYVNVPTDINFFDCVFDGYYMGFTGTGASVNMSNTLFLRYSDLQASDGSNPGGSLNAGSGANWLAPPHAIYLQDGDPSLNAHLRLVQIYDAGLYTGGATRRPVSGSGSLLSLKASMSNGTVIDGYTSLRPDGCQDVIANFAGGARGLIRNVTCVFDSSVSGSDGTHPWGVRFPSAGGYTSLVFENYTITDNAAVPTAFPIIGNGYQTNADVVFRNLKVFQNDWFNWSPGFRFGGTNISVDAEYHYAQTSGNGTFNSVVFEQGTDGCDSCTFDVKLFGWRQVPVTFSAALASGATTGSLSASVYPSGWQLASGTYQLHFASNDVRYVTFTNGSTTLGTWAALTAASTATGNIAGNTYATNYSGYKPRIIIAQAGQSLNTKVHVIDVSNGWDGEVDNGMLTEHWSQMWNGTPTGSTYTLPMSFPSTMALDRQGWLPTTNLDTANGLTSVGVGWTGSPTAIFSAAGITTSANPFTPAGSTVSLGGSNRTILLTPTAGTFGTTGKVTVALRGTQVSAVQ